MVQSPPARAQREPARRVAAWLTACVALVVTLSGCARMEIGSQFRSDGSATHSIMLVFDRDVLSASDLARVNQQLPAIASQAQDNGYTAERLDTASDIGMRITSTTTDGTDPTAELNSLLNSLNNDLEVAPARRSLERLSARAALSAAMPGRWT